MKEFAGRTAVVTGAASGIGFATARRFAQEGMNVVLSDIEGPALDKAEHALAEDGHAVLGVRADVSNWNDVQALADRAVERFGAVHVVHNNAGVVIAAPVEEFSFENWNWVLGVNLWGVIYGIKAFLPILRKQSEGHIVNTSSTAGVMAPAHIAPYSVAKFGVVGLSETLHRELAQQGSPIGVSVLIPGSTRTAIVESTRNQPPDSAATHHATQQQKVFEEGARGAVSEGKDPAEVADLVLEGIRNRRFWLFTHELWHEVMRERVEALVTTGQLTDRFGG